LPSDTDARNARRCIWLREAIVPGEADAPALAGDTRADVCIVGGGYTGLWTAIELRRRDPSIDVVILEADICGGGASGRNSGMVLPLWAKFQAIEELGGTDGAKAFCRASDEIIDTLQAFCVEHGIDAGFRRDGWVWGAACAAQRGRGDALLEHFDRLGLAPFERLDAAGIQALAGTDAFSEGLYCRNAATIHPGRLVRGFRRVALEAGIRIHEHSPMVRLQRGSSPAVITPNGRVDAARVVLAMNAWSLAIPELRPAILVITSDDGVSEPVPGLLAEHRYDRGPIFCDSQLFVSGFRTTDDGRINPGVTGGTIGFGTLRGQRFEGPSPRGAAIADILHRCFPALADVPMATTWYGPIDRTRSGLPLFGALPGSPSILYGYGLSGNGIATCPLAGRILASLTLGAHDEWSGCALVRPVDRWMPPEPFRYIGAHLVREAVRKQDQLAYTNERPGWLTRRFAALAPGGIVTTRTGASH